MDSYVGFKHLVHIFVFCLFTFLVFHESFCFILVSYLCFFNVFGMHTGRLYEISKIINQKYMQ